MMKFLVLSTLVLAIFATSRFVAPNKRSIMAVMTEVEARLNSGGPLDAIVNILNDFRDSVNYEQVNHDDIYQTEQKECESEHEFRHKQITDSSNVLRDSTATLASCQKQKIRAADAFQVTEKQQFTNEQFKATITSVRDKEDAYFKNRSQVIEDALFAIDEAQDILGGMSNGSRSFVQLSAVSKRLLLSAIQLKAPFATVLSALANLHNDDSAIERCSQLLDALRKNIKESYSEMATSNANAVSSYNEQKERLANNAVRLQKRYDRLEHHLSEIAQCIGTQSAVAQAASNKLSRNTQLFEQAQKLCATFDNEFNYATQQRRAELLLVVQLEEMIERRFAQVNDESDEIHSRMRQH